MSRLRFLLYPFSILYDGVTRLRNMGFEQGWLSQHSFEIPIVAVGNLSTGGTGKTPMIEYLIRANQGKRIAVLSRGYGRKTKGYFKVGNESSAAQVGDEPLQFKLKFGDDVVVAVCENRVDGITRLLKEHQLDLILLDDAYQHRYVKASTYILLTSYDQPYFQDYLLPAGNLRESRAGANRAQHIVVTKCPVNLSEEGQAVLRKRIAPRSHQNLYFTTIKYGSFLTGDSESLPLENLREKDVAVVTGIAKPTYFLEYLESNGLTFQHYSFSDHHRFTGNDVQRFRNHDYILSTEKDYVRLKKFELNNLLFLGIETQFIGPELELSISGN